MAVDYPVNLTVDYPDRKLNRLTSFFRIFAAIPILIILSLLVADNFGSGGSSNAGSNAGNVAVGIGFTFLPLVLMLLFRRKYPRWWYDWNVNLAKFCYRVDAYLYLLTDVYPSTDEDQSVHVEIQYPDASALNRWLPLVKWFLAIPHVIILICLTIAILIVTIIAWFAILFTGVYPRGLFNFVTGVLRWGIRVVSYAIILVTDKYPPFSLDA
jgi:hypothetical protein